jgi:hypothetical protein
MLYLATILVMRSSLFLSAELLLGELAPLGADILEKNLLRVSRRAGARRSGIRGYWVHERYLQNIDETSSECASFKQYSNVAMNYDKHRGRRPFD